MTASRKLLADEKPVDIIFDVVEWQKQLAGFVKELTTIHGGTDRGAWVKDLAAKAKAATPEYSVLVSKPYSPLSSAGFRRSRGAALHITLIWLPLSFCLSPQVLQGPLRTRYSSRQT